MCTERRQSGLYRFGGACFMPWRTGRNPNENFQGEADIDLRKRGWRNDEKSAEIMKKGIHIRPEL